MSAVLRPHPLMTEGLQCPAHAAEWRSLSVHGVIIDRRELNRLHDRLDLLAARVRDCPACLAREVMSS